MNLNWISTDSFSTSMVNTDHQRILIILNSECDQFLCLTTVVQAHHNGQIRIRKDVKLGSFWNHQSSSQTSPIIILDGDPRSGIKSGMTFILHLFKNSKFEMSQNEWNNKTPLTTSIIHSASSATGIADPTKLILPIKADTSLREEMWVLCIGAPFILQTPLFRRWNELTIQAHILKSQTGQNTSE